jgi:ribosomal-protein-alanine N-acetyltransferase
MANRKSDSGFRLTYRKLLVSDARRLLAVEQQAHIHPWSIDSFLDLLPRDDTRAFGLLDKSLLVGFFVYQLILDEAHLLNLCVSPEYQGQGIGSRLLAASFEDAMALGARRMLLEVRAGNTNALSLYRRSGFVQVGLRRNYYPGPEGREDAVLMTCELEESVL